jgi:hypothetical protein
VHLSWHWYIHNEAPLEVRAFAPTLAKDAQSFGKHMSKVSTITNLGNKGKNKTFFFIFQFR